MTNEIFTSIMILTVIVGYDIAHTPIKVPVANAKETIIEPTPTPQATPTPQDPQTPAEYIAYKFKEHAEKAFKVLQGEECAENRTLDPNAVNDNTWWGGVGRDRGIFQINDVYHPLTDEQAFDWKQNIDYAYRMFVNDDYTFVRWTCGKYYGI